MSLLQALQLPKPKNFLPMASGPNTTAAAPTAKPKDATAAKAATSADPDAELRAKALHLQTTIEAKRKQQAELLKQLQDAEPKLEKLAAAAKDADTKKAVGEKQALVAKKKAQVERELTDIEADLAAIDNPGAKPDALVKVLAKHGSGGKVDKTTDTFDLGKDSLKSHPLKQEVTTTTASADKNVSTVEKNSETSSLGAKGLTTTSSKEKEVSGEHLTARTSEEKKTNVSLTGKLTQEESKKNEIELPDGSTSSLEKSTSKEISAKGASKSETVKHSNFDGSATEVTKKTGMERGDGKLNVTSETSVTRTNEKGTDRTTEKKASGGLIAGKDGIGAGGEGEVGKKITSKGGKQAGASLKLHASVTCNIEEPKGDSDKYAVTLTVDVGGSASVSGGLGQKEGAKASGSVEGHAGKGQKLVVKHMLDAKQLELYTSSLEAASKGSQVAATEKEFAVIAAVAKNDTATALALLGSGGKVDKKATDTLVNEGDSIKVSDSTNKGGGLKGEGKGVAIGATAEVTDTNSLEVTRNKEGGIDAETEHEHGTEKGLSGSMTPGAVGVSVAYKKEHKTSFGYAITLDKKNDPDGKVLEALGKCRSEPDYEAFLKTYKGKYTLTGKTKGVADSEGLDTGLSIAGVDVAGMSEGHGVAEKTKTDADGNLLEKTVTGTGSIGGKLLGASDSRHDEATAEIKGKKVKLNLKTTENSSHSDGADEKKKKLAQDKLAGKAPATGALATAAGGGEEPDTDTHDVSGLTLTNKDLRRLGKSCCNSPSAFIGWRRRADEKDDLTKAAQAIVKGKGTAAAVAEALARFIGGDSVERLETVRLMVRGRSAKPTMGVGFEFPDSIAGLQKAWETLTDPDLIKGVQAIGDKKQENGLKECVRLLKMLDELSSGISACKDFKNPDLKAEMVLKLNLIRPPLAAGVKGFAGKPDAPDMKELEATGKRLLGQCIACFQDKDKLVYELGDLKGDYPRFRSIDKGDARKLIKKLDDLVYRWRSQWMLLGQNYVDRGMSKTLADVYMVIPDETVVAFWEKACGD